MNLITNQLAFRRQAAGGGAAINLNVPPPPLLADSIVVAIFHTHPNLGLGWTPGPSPVDLLLDARDGDPQGLDGI